MNVTGMNLPKTTPSTPMKVMCDAALHDHTGMSYAGLVFQDHTGRTIELTGTTLGKGYTSVLAEIEAVLRALDVLCNYDDVKHVKIYSDCRPAVEKLNDYQLNLGFESITIDWIPREQNREADLAAEAWNAKENHEGHRVTPYGSTD